MPTVPEYFAALAASATQAVEDEFEPLAGSTIPVVDTAQRCAAATWQSVSVHPLQVLETGYQDVVRASVAGAATDEARRDAESQALSQFFALGSTDLLRLEVPPDLTTVLGAQPLVQDLLDRMAAEAAVVRWRLDHDQPGLQTLGLLGNAVDAAAAAVAAMAPERLATPLPPALEKAAGYLGMLGTGWTADAAAASWRQTYQQWTSADQLEELLGTVQDQLVRPLRDPDVAVAAVRALYNIEAFTLLRLVHRFKGGTAETPMTADQRRFASDALTGAMHPASVGAWLEARIAALGAELTRVDSTLRAQLGGSSPVVRFYLKGGRALFTALGTPARGTNDWDTGILIDPGLDPDRWYTVFACVHDTVVRVLDGFRFAYTNHLYGDVPPVPGAASVTADADPGNMVFSAAADVAEAHLRRAQDARALPVAMAVARVGARALGAQPVGRPVGLNGELVDVGIPTRSSVELRELWCTLTVAPKPGTSGVALPVPTLPYFVADLSTILREALTDDGPPDRKLGKRLVRLAAVLTSDDLTSHVAALRERVTAALPATSAHLGLGGGDDSAAARLRVVTLADLLDSQPVPADLVPALDAYLATLDLDDERQDDVQRIWRAVEDGIDESQRATARTLLAVQAGAHRVAAAVVADRRAREKGLGIGADLGSASPLGTALDALTDVTSRPGNALVVTGALAQRLQLWHAGVTDGATVAPVDRVTADLWVHGLTPAACAAALGSLKPRLAALGDVTVEGTGLDARLVVRRDLTAPPVVGVAGKQVVLVVRPVAGDVSGLDSIRGWSLAPPRQQVEDLLDQAASTPDFDLREAVHAGSDALLQRVLGRPAGTVRGRRAF